MTCDKCGGNNQVRIFFGVKHETHICFDCKYEALKEFRATEGLRPIDVEQYKRINGYRA